ncbi:hypothetical protein RYA05_02700 [Pseudomonas syringae pv. actinidiae]|nr:hypothetical protein [Pseudomonas syringae pv. actinidiae]
MENAPNRLHLPGLKCAIWVVNSLKSPDSAEDAFSARISNIIFDPDNNSAIPAGFVQLPAKMDQVTINRICRHFSMRMPWLTTEKLVEIYEAFLACKPYGEELSQCSTIEQSGIEPAWWGNNTDGSEDEMEALFTEGLSAANEATCLNSYDLTLLPGLKYAMRLCGHSVFGGTQAEMLKDINDKISDVSRLPAVDSEAFILMPVTGVYHSMDDKVQIALAAKGYLINPDDLIDIYAMFIERRPYSPMFNDASGEVFVDAWDKRYADETWGHRPTAMAYFADGWYAGMRNRRLKAR